MKLAALFIAAACLFGCGHVHTKTFLTTNPLYYTDLVPGNQESWEDYTWEQTEKDAVRRYPKELFQGPTAVCTKQPKELDRPKVTAVHAFNFGQALAMHNEANNLILYPIGNIDILRHEYVHAQNSQWSHACLSEMLAIERGKNWNPKSKRAR